MAACVPTISTWSLSGVPKFLPVEQIQRVLNCCDRKTAIGKRNYAILLLLARLGLRAGEVVALTLDDIDWEAGLITVRGKGKRVAQMPLPVEAGAAIADYLRQARPDCSSRRVFIRQNAPLVGFANSIAICSLVDRALERAGVESSLSRLPSVPSQLGDRDAQAGSLLVRDWRFAAPSPSGHNHNLCQGRPSLAPFHRPALAGR
jgi:integrase